MFKVGDRVRRIRGGSYDNGKGYIVRVGDVIPVGAVRDETSIRGAGQDYGWMRAEFFELTEWSGPSMLLPEDPKARKGMPITTGVLDYFPNALAMVAMCSKAGNDQHNPGQPLHWDKNKSGDHADCIARHLIDRRSLDTDGIPHAVKLAWRALANLETMIENGEVKL